MRSWYFMPGVSDGATDVDNTARVASWSITHAGGAIGDGARVRVWRCEIFFSGVQPFVSFQSLLQGRGLDHCGVGGVLMFHVLLFSIL